MSEKDHQKQSSDDNGWVNMVEKLTQDLIDLQTQVLFMEDTLDKLDNIVTEQSQLIADQQRQFVESAATRQSRDCACLIK